jgi:hypothetical protein
MPQHIEQLPVRVRQRREADRGSANRQTAGRCRRRLWGACCMACRSGCSGVDVARTRQTGRRRALRKGSGGFAIRRGCCRRSSKGEHRSVRLRRRPAVLSWRSSRGRAEQMLCCFSQTCKGKATDPLQSRGRHNRSRGEDDEGGGSVRAVFPFGCREGTVVLPSPPAAGPRRLATLRFNSADGRRRAALLHPGTETTSSWSSDVTCMCLAPPAVAARVGLGTAQTAS